MLYGIAFVVSLGTGCILLSGITAEELTKHRTKRLRDIISQKDELIISKSEVNNQLYLTVKSLEKSLNDKNSDIQLQLNQQRLQLIAQYSKEINTITGERDKYKRMLLQKDGQLKTDYEALFQQKIRETKAEYEGKMKALQEREAKAKDKLQNQLKKALEELGEWRMRSPEFERRELELDRKKAELEVERRDLDGQYRLYQQEASLTTDQFQRQINGYERQIEQAMTQIQQLTQALQETEHLEQAYLALKRDYANCQAQLAEFVPAVPDEVRVMVALFFDEGVRVEFINHSCRNDIDRYEFKPLDKISSNALETVRYNLPGHLDWLFCEPSIHRIGGKIIIEIDQSDKGEKLFNHVRVDPNWVASALTDSVHIRLIGSTGDGKSTTANNILNCAVSMGYEPILIDPKYYSPEHDGWWINGTEFTPQYRDEAECLVGVKKMLQEIFRRKAEVKKAKDNGLEVPTFSKQFYIIDEFVNLTEADEDNEIKSDLARVLREGRSFGIKCLYMGQEVNVSSYGKSKASVKNGSNIILKGLINEALDRSDMGFNKRDTEAIKATVEEIEKRGHKYYGLVRINDSNWYLAIMPKPNYFDCGDDPHTPHTHPTQIPESTDITTPHTPQSSNIEVTTAPYCPNCGTTKLESNGTYKGNKRYRCLNAKCNTKTFTFKG